MWQDKSSRLQRATAVSGLILCACLAVPPQILAQEQVRVLGSPSVQADRSSGAGIAVLSFRNDLAKPLFVVLSAGPVTISGASKAGDA